MEAPLNRRTLLQPTISLALGAALLGAAPLAAQVPDSSAPITLETALREAELRNAQLPVARMEVQAAIARVQQAHGALYPRLSIASDMHTGAPQDYAGTEAFPRVLGQTPLYEGGELRAGLAQARAEANALGFSYRMSVRDVDRAVRSGYSLVLRAQAGLSFRQRGLERLEAYLRVIEARRAAGQGVGSDLLRTRQRVAAAHANIAAAQRELEDARMELNELLGLAPDSALELSALPAPAPPAPPVDSPWVTVPDVAQSEAQIRAAAAGVRAARAGRKPHLDFEADIGAQPFVGSDVALLNGGRGAGAEVMLAFSLPFWDAGIHRGRLAEAAADMQRARDRAVQTRRLVRLSWSRAWADMAGFYREYEARTEAATAAQDAYLEAESLYRGGQGSALEVLDAYDAWIQALQDRQDAIYGYRAAEADLIRWGSR